MDRTRYRNVSRAQQERQTWSKKRDYFSRLPCKKDRLFFAITVDKCWPEWYTDVHLYPSEPPQLVRLFSRIQR